MLPGMEEEELARAPLRAWVEGAGTGADGSPSGPRDEALGAGA